MKLSDKTPHSRSYLLPWPPSVNKALTVARGRKILSPKTRKWQKLAAEELALQRPLHLEGPCWVAITLHPQDKRRFDIDNKVKSVLDALVAGGVLSDDNCTIVKAISVTLGECVDNAVVIATVGPITYQLPRLDKDLIDGIPSF